MRKGIVIAGAIVVLLFIMLLISSATVGKGWLLQKEEVEEEEPVVEDYEFPVWYRIGFVVVFTLALGITFLFLRVQETKKRV